MSDEGEKTCPLCAEEMDLTDQQLKPCQCGYEICVWCWHHIMEMAEKDETEGRCPACRSPYDKEKIVGTAAKCERLVAEISMERKMKNHKAKTKSIEGRKQLSSVRVIQRNLVYIVGLPLNLADEDLLHRREYFGQYGKVLKVSMSRTAAGVIQQFPNNTCSVYITYTKEDEAIRCIQNVHGFVLDGRLLRACFGTTKYCHAWLRNMPCSNPDCLYLHEIGSQEDSFTKDEIISAYTRSRVQQVTGAANNMQRRSGSLLPPPLDDYTNQSSGKAIVKSASSNPANIVRGSPPNGISGRSVVLPAAAAWGARAPSSQPLASGQIVANEPSKPTPDTNSSMPAFSSAVGASQTSLSHNDGGKNQTLNEENHSLQPKSKTEPLKPLNQPVSMDCQSHHGDGSATDASALSVTSVGSLSSLLSSKETDRLTGVTEKSNIYINAPEDQGSGSLSEEACKLCSMSLVDIDKEDRDDSGLSGLDGYVSENVMSSPQNQGLPQQNHVPDKSRESLLTTGVGNSTSPINGFCTSKEQFGFDSISKVQDTVSEVEEDIISFDNQRLHDPEVICHPPYLSNSAFHLSSHLRPLSLQHNERYNAPSVNIGFVPVDNRDSRASNCSLVHRSSIAANGYLEKFVSSSTSGLDRTLGHSLPFLERETGQPGLYIGETASTGSNAADKGENNIISDILSLDFDPLDGSLTSPHNLAKILSDTDEQSGPLKISNSWRAHSNCQSKFSFARQEEPNGQAFDMHPPLNPIESLSMGQSIVQDFAHNLYMEQKGVGNNFSSSDLNEFDNLGRTHPFVSPAKNLAVPRVQISAPPGFSVPSRPPPPGFSSQDRIDQAFDSCSGKLLLNSALRNSYQTPASENINSTGGIEFMDPAILAVGEGRIHGGVNNIGLDMRSNVPSQLNTLENEAKLQLLMQRSLSAQQDLGFSEMGNSVSLLGDSYGVASRLLDQSQLGNFSPFGHLPLQQPGNTMFSNSQWDGWNDLQGGNRLEVADLLRNERLGSSKFYAGYDDPKYRIPKSGNLYNRTFRM